MSTTLQSLASADALLHKAVNEGVESRVEVNQRSLIDKLLARYSSDFVIFRELIQNSDDAQANSFRLEITCDTAGDFSKFQQHDLDKLKSQPQYSDNVFSNIGSFFRNRRKSVKVSPDQGGTDSASHSQPESTLNQTLPSQEIVFDSSTITEMRAVNNGTTFTEVDWKRVATIAEGNTNVDAIGQFGVGFFTVFSYSEQPIIKSGKECMVFVWKDGRSLTTFRTQLSVEEQSPTTSVILKMRNKHILETKSITNIDFTVTDENKNDESKSIKKKKNADPNDISPKINLNQLKAYFIKVLSFTKHINELAIVINGLTVFHVNKTKKTIPSSQTTLTFKNSSTSNNKNEMLRLSSSVHAEQTFTIANGPSITLNHIDVELIANIDQTLHDKIRQTLQKSLPSTLHIQILFPYINTFNKQQLFSSPNNDLHTQILNLLIPLKLQNDRILPFGHIFIGLATHQTTGIGMHVYSQLVPTIERVNLDLQDPYIKIWNKEILTSVGKISRLIYDQMIHVSLENYDVILASYSFQPTAPNTEIGSILLDGFFSSTKDILVPVKRTPSDSQLSLLPSTKAFVTNSKYIASFLPIPFVPLDFGTKHFFSVLKQRGLIQEISYARIVSELKKTILLSTEFIALLNWLCSGEISTKSAVKEILYNIRFRENAQSPIITLHQLEFYDLSNISSHLLLPSNVLPTNIATHLSCEQLCKSLFLSEISVDYLCNFYLDRNQQKLFCDANTSLYLFSFISQYWNRMNILVLNQLKAVLSTLKCISTTQGMKLPHESYVRATTLSPKLPFITLNILQNPKEDDNDNEAEHDKTLSNERLDNPVSIDFLKWIGCRTIQVPESDDGKKTRSNKSSSLNSEDNQVFIQDLLTKRQNMSEADLNALKQSKCLIGTTLDSTAKKNNKYVPRDLHFPSVADQLNWSTILILDWPDIDSHSPEYAFLKEIGVREAPDLSVIIDRIIEEHNDNQRQQPKMTMNEYKLPNGLTFLVSNFHQQYIKQWDSLKSEKPFLPSYYPTTMFDQNSDKKDIQVELSAPSNVFKDESPLFAVPIPEVIELFINHCDISLIGVKQHPTLSIAFNKLIQRRNDLLTVQSAPKLFSYLNRLGGLNHASIDEINKHAFIPVSDQSTFVKPSQVFIRSNTPNITHFLAGMNTNGLIDFVDYGHDANLFLHNVGVLHYPPPRILAEFLLDRQAKYFSGLKDENNNLLLKKLRVYTTCLEQLAAFSTCTNELRIDPLNTRLKNEPWCLGYQRVLTKDGTETTTYKIAKPKEIYLNDDQQCVIDLKPLCAPDEPNLNNFYAQYGSKWLSESVKRTLIHRGKPRTTTRSKELLELIQQRFNMLFVDDRGEKINNVNDRRIELLRNSLSVYETEGIQCQLTLQNNTTTVKSTECSSCALEYINNKVELYIRSDVSDIQYFDIANELARFVITVQNRSTVLEISNKLSSSLDSLKRQGIPVDRLLKTTDKQVTIIEPPPNIPEQVKDVQPDKKSIQKQEKDKADENKKSLTKSNGHSTAAGDESHTIQTYIEHGCVPDFGQNKSIKGALVSTLIKKVKAYNESELNNREYVKYEINMSCERVPAANMTRYKDIFHSIPLYVEKNVTITKKMIDQAKQLACLLNGLATQVFKIPVKSIHLFRDIDGDRIAFNMGGAIFFNLRYFEQVFGDEIDPLLATSSDPFLCRIVNFYFMTMCHELTHNRCSGHDTDFIFTMQLVAVELMTENQRFLQQFSLKNYA